ncbi:hypothetical protein A0H81_03332 [Grifola frondosa]|uniref:Uncharacterized protein n=1 Tax=Grifola frondosa TaxID=5627 RepID=A0A1C7MM89_GRIFR|nr:hypothetical protein A0H81_03332 [Grifola frondosa]
MAHRNVPLEIWSKIFLLACTDGGATGAALAQVSKFFQAASLPIRLHSLAFTSLLQLESFLVFVDVQQKSFPSHRGPKVRHVLIGDFHAQPPSRNILVDFLQDALAPDDFRRNDKVLWDACTVRAITRLLRLVAPNVRTLSVVNPHSLPLPWRLLVFHCWRS